MSEKQAEGLPEPLVPPDVDLRDFAFMPLDVARLRDSDLAANETPEACWAAVLLWAASWHQIPAASIPNDDRWIAKQAGYAQRGKIAREWAIVRSGALRNWVECNDGRLYHPVVAEKAMDGWRAKLRQRWNAECARIKKHNQRHETSLACPPFEEWTKQGCPSGLANAVPRDIDHPERDNPGCPQDDGGDMASKREGERQGKGERQGDSEREGEARLLPGGSHWRDASGLASTTSADLPDLDHFADAAETQPRPSSRRKATRLPDDWAPNMDDQTFAEGEGFCGRDLDKVADGFRDFWTAKSGQDATKLDWHATWRNWVRRERKPHRETGPGGRPMTGIASALAGIAAASRMLPED